jgi:hypothetical protein
VTQPRSRLSLTPSTDHCTFLQTREFSPQTFFFLCSLSLILAVANTQTLAHQKESTKEKRGKNAREE